MEKYIEQFYHNEYFLNKLLVDYPSEFYDWKITVAFYTALQLMKAYIKKKRNIDSVSHEDIKRHIINIQWRQGDCAVSESCYSAYDELRNLSEACRYFGKTKLETAEKMLIEDLEIAQKNLLLIKKYFLKHKII